MSKIQKELCDATEIDPKRDESRQSFLVRLAAAAANQLPDALWDKLSPAAQDWVNEAADAANAKKELSDFPDVEPPAESGGGRRRVSGTAPAASDPFEPKVKDDVKVTTKRGSVITGKIVEMDKEVVVLQTPAGKEEEVLRDRIEKIEPLAGGAADPAEEGPRDPVKGDVVTLVTKRGKKVTGDLVSISAEEIVIKVDGAEEDYLRDRVESIKIEGGKSSQGATSGAASGISRRTTGNGGADNPDAEGGAVPDGRRTRASNGNVSVGTRIRELIIADMKMSVDDISKTLKKEGLEFRDNTLALNYSEAHKMLDLLKAAGKLK